MLNSTINYTDVLEPGNTVNSAIVKDFAFFQNLNASCPYSNGTLHTASNGLKFEVSCKTNINGNDLVSWTEVNGTHDHHSDSFDDCMQFCSTMRPKCYGVSYDPGMAYGYRNCYPKTADSNTGTVLSSNILSSPIKHSAIAIFESDTDPRATGCSSGTSTHDASGGTTFSVT